ncbi:plexin-B isoform X1 [Dermacentor silvarum]|uniref:plexin-B isoform X1 n=1 Tax=Dermacentor silvarum TaxID=543639 RepID=UPI00189B3919|nr:plexin-B isoform X1 [Dermacentor silvarum]
MHRPRQRGRCASGRHGAAAATAAMALLSLPPLLLAMLLHAAEAARLVSAADDGVVASYRSYNESVNFTHLVLDRVGGRLYLGATNRLYQLDAARLQLQVDLATGPVQDSVLCSPASCEGYPTLPTNNVNKVLLIDPVAQKLIVCGSARQGACQRHSLSDVAEKEPLVPTPVAANDENSSTFALIAPSHYYGRDSRALYVATTNSRQGPYRDMVPAICTRSLEPESERFRIIEPNFSESARIDMAHHIKDYYLVRYVYGFHTDEYVYFATVQRKSHLRASEELGYISRLARVCTSDPAYNTYTEVTLQCVGPDGTDYNLLQDAVVFDAGDDLSRELRLPLGGGGRRRRVLAAVFALSRDHTARSARRSALCLYPLRDVERRFTENIHMCYNGSVLTRNMDYIAGSVQSCPEPGQSGNVLSFCNETLKLNGSSPISRAASAVFENLTLTSVAAAATPQHSVAFLGSDRGRLKKMFLTNQGRAEQFEEVTIDDGNPILPDMEVDKTGHFLYVASPYKVSKVRVDRCQQYNTCDQCLQARNPYCGWCSLEKRCTVQSECLNASAGADQRSSSRWLSLDTQQCIDFQSIAPEKLPRSATTTVEIAINQLPQLPRGAHYECVFGHSAPIQAKATQHGLACSTPAVPDRPPIPVGSDHVDVTLYIRSSETNTDFLHRPFTFYDCSVHKTCSACVTSAFACNWCFSENTCTHNATSCSRNVISGENSPQNSLVKGRQHCPSFGADSSLLLANGVRTEVAVEARNLPSPADNFHCVLDIEGRRERVQARVVNNKIICSQAVYSYQSEIPEQQGTLTVLWNGNTFIGKANVTLYKCQLLGSHGGRADCSLCLTRDPKYRCSWCGGVCATADSCDQPVSTTCPPPRIDWIHPLSGPIEGGTQVTIEGSNLGTSQEEIYDKIKIGGIPCIPTEYNVSVRVVCRTGASGSPLTADVVVGNRAGITQAKEKFQYRQVTVRDLQPRTGPQSGGTRLYISGSNLNVGSNLTVFLDNLPCTVDKTLASNSQISCKTSKAAIPKYNVSYLILKIDNATLSIPSPFNYSEDPTILKISPLKSFVGGGRNVMVTGSNLNAVQQPRMAVFYENQILNETVCEVLSPSLMSCPSPPINAEAYRQLPSSDRQKSLGKDNRISGGSHTGLSTSYNNDQDAGGHRDEWRFRIGFTMDDVSSVLELPRTFPLLHSDLVYVPNPQLHRVEGDGVKLYKGELLVIEGSNLRLASTESEVNVTIGTQSCNITSLTMNQLLCWPPEVQPSGTDELGRWTDNGLPMVVVRIGSNLRYEVGFMRYEVAKTYSFPPEAVAGLAAGALAVVLLSAVILLVLRHKSSQAEREYKRIQLQMDDLEKSVRIECKQAFAELQTVVTDLTNDLQSAGIPTLDHRSYIMKVFFPGVYEHPLLQDNKVKNNGIYSNYEVAMSQFEQLILNKSFLVTFINTLESQKSFTIRDRVNVASLLMIVFMGRLEYGTDVLRTLLLQLIEKSVSSKHPQLMLRRTESVVEKMLTNWLALSMYDYLRDYAGSSLFLLFSAIKHQVEKGPVDAVTYDARYSLFEARLLREQIDYEVVTIQVIQEDQDEKIHCRVNDCDTISQVKSKILDTLYKNTPFSLRPSIHDVDLEWRNGRSGHLILADEDMTTKTVNGWRQINTLRHYNVKDSAVMSLVMKQNDSFSSNCNVSLNSMSPIVSHCELEQGIKYWHLVKPEDETIGQPKDIYHKAIPEIFLTRLLSTKGTVEKFVEDFFKTILTVNEALPPAIKWLFDLLDEAAHRHGIIDPEVPHAWKSNCLPLRFWVNFIKNPDFILDVQKSPIVDSCLSVIAQTLMDACSTSEHRLGKDSPSNKLLFARDIPKYRRKVLEFYQGVALQPKVTDQEMCAVMQALSLAHSSEFEPSGAVKELYVYAAKYREQVLMGLEGDLHCRKLHLSHKLLNVACTLEGEQTSMC